MVAPVAVALVYPIVKWGFFASVTAATTYWTGNVAIQTWQRASLADGLYQGTKRTSAGVTSLALSATSAIMSGAAQTVIEQAAPVVKKAQEQVTNQIKKITRKVDQIQQTVTQTTQSMFNIDVKKSLIQTWYVILRQQTLAETYRKYGDLNIIPKQAYNQHTFNPFVPYYDVQAYPTQQLYGYFINRQLILTFHDAYQRFKVDPSNNILKRYYKIQKDKITEVINRWIGDKASSQFQAQKILQQFIQRQNKPLFQQYFQWATSSTGLSLVSFLLVSAITYVISKPTLKFAYGIFGAFIYYVQKIYTLFPLKQHNRQRKELIYIGFVMLLLGSQYASTVTKQKLLQYAVLRTSIYDTKVTTAAFTGLCRNALQQLKQALFSTQDTSQQYLQALKFKFMDQLMQPFQKANFSSDQRAQLSKILQSQIQTFGIDIDPRYHTLQSWGRIRDFFSYKRIRKTQAYAVFKQKASKLISDRLLAGELQQAVEAQQSVQLQKFTNQEITQITQKDLDDVMKLHPFGVQFDPYTGNLYQHMDQVGQISNARFDQATSRYWRNFREKISNAQHLTGLRIKQTWNYIAQTMRFPTINIRPQQLHHHNQNLQRAMTTNNTGQIVAERLGQLTQTFNMAGGTIQNANVQGTAQNQGQQQPNPQQGQQGQQNPPNQQPMYKTLTQSFTTLKPGITISASQKILAGIGRMGGVLLKSLRSHMGSLPRYAVQMLNWAASQANRMVPKSWSQIFGSKPGKTAVTWGFDKPNGVTQIDQTKPAWLNYANLQTVRISNQNSVSAQVQQVFRYLLLQIGFHVFLKIKAPIIQYLLAVGVQFPMMDIVQSYSYAAQQFQSQRSYAQIILNAQLVKKAKKLIVGKRPPDVFVWDDLFVVFQAKQSPFIMYISGPQAPLQIALQFGLNFATRRVTSCLILLMGKKFSYTLDNTGLIWDLAQMIIKTKYSFNQQTYKSQTMNAQNISVTVAQQPKKRN